MQFNEVPGAYASPNIDQPSTISSAVNMLKRRWPLMLACILFCVAVAAFITALIPKTYQSSSFLAVNSDANKVTNLDASDPLSNITQLDEPPTADAHVRLLGADALKAAYAQELGRPINKIPVITVNPPLADNLITVAAEDRTPQSAADDANKYVQLYLGQLIAKRNQDLNDALSGISQQANLAQNALNQAENRQQAFEQKYGIAGLSQSRESQVQNVGTVKSQQEQTEAALSAAVARVASLKAQLANIPQFVSTVPSASSDESVQSLQKEISDLQATDAGLSKQYAPTYYKRAPVLAQIASLQIELKQLQSDAVSRNLKPSDEYNKIETELQEAQADRQSLYAEEDGLRREVGEQNGELDRLTYLLTQDAQLSREVDQLGANWRLLNQKRDGLKLQIANPSLNIRVQDAAEPPVKPIKPNWLSDLLLGLVLGLLAAWYMASVAESRDDRIYSADEAASLIGAPVIASVPLMMGTENNAPHEIVPLASQTEFYRRLAATLTFAANGAGNASPALVIGSAGRGEGRSIMISNLATVAGMDGRKVLIVDADTRNPTQHERFNTPMEPGLTDYLLGREKLANVIHPTACKNVQVVPCGMSVPNPIQLLYSNRMAKFIDATRDLADLILYDVPACDGVIDPAIVASQVDGVLMVTGHESASRSKYIDAVDLMEDAHAKIIGVVSTDEMMPKAARRRKSIDLTANTVGNRELLTSEQLKLVPPVADQANVAGKWRRPAELESPAAIPQPSAPIRESNFVFSPATDSNGSTNGHKSSTNGSSTTGAE